MKPRARKGVVWLSRRCQEDKCGRGTNMCSTAELRRVALSLWTASGVGGRRPAQGEMACLEPVGKMVCKAPGLT